MDTTIDDDFTFASVTSPNSKDVVDTKDLASQVDGITLKDGLLDNQSNDLVWKDKSLNQVTPKEETIGSLSFKVIDSSSSSKTQSNDSSETTFKVPARKPITRTKVPFEKGLKGESNMRLITMDGVKKHRSGDSMSTVLKGKVYNISPYMNFHPGGVDMLMKAVGRDGTLLFNTYHAWVNYEVLLEKCLVGILDDTKRKAKD